MVDVFVPVWVWLAATEKLSAGTALGRALWPGRVRTNQKWERQVSDGGYYFLVVGVGVA